MLIDRPSAPAFPSPQIPCQVLEIGGTALLKSHQNQVGKAEAAWGWIFRGHDIVPLPQQPEDIQIRAAARQS